MAMASSQHKEVMATGKMKASLNELAYILRSTTDAGYDMVIRSLYKDYIHGAVVHVVDVSPGSSSSSAMKRMVDAKLTIKTSAFDRSRIFKKHEHWCFLEYCKKTNDIDTFTVTLTSIPENDFDTRE